MMAQLRESANRDSTANTIFCAVTDFRAALRMVGEMKRRIAVLFCALAGAICAWGTPGIAINGTSSPVNTGATAQFSATLTEVAGTVQWSVNGVNGGNSTVGTISAAGLYKAPSKVPNPNVVT